MTLIQHAIGGDGERGDGLGWDGLYLCNHVLCHANSIGIHHDFLLAFIKDKIHTVPSWVSISGNDCIMSGDFRERFSGGWAEPLM